MNFCSGELQAEPYEKKARAITVSKLHDPFGGNGFDVIGTWNRYKSTGDPRVLKRETISSPPQSRR